MKNKIVYVDMDGVLADFESALVLLDSDTLTAYEGRFDEVPGLFSLMKPMPLAVDSFLWLSSRFDTYILSTAPWDNPSAWSDKLIWVKKHLGDAASKRLILSHNKHLNLGDFLIDDRLKNGADRFGGTHIHFGTDQFQDWNAVRVYLANYLEEM